MPNLRMNGEVTLKILCVCVCVCVYWGGGEGKWGKGWFAGWYICQTSPIYSTSDNKARKSPPPTPSPGLSPLSNEQTSISVWQRSSCVSFFPGFRTHSHYAVCVWNVTTLIWGFALLYYGKKYRREYWDVECEATQTVGNIYNNDATEVSDYV